MGVDFGVPCVRTGSLKLAFIHVASTSSLKLACFLSVRTGSLKLAVSIDNQTELIIASGQRRRKLFKLDWQYNCEGLL
ncbi:hypothetical protein L596_002685 [Steinernema carpocapsae]|uniref:Uncharacterized protein n=1 Tax=Steinernema carpocapsae TaxID=34508 RepID=A0A4U8UPY2_STECR|nr:hypothetical protein L596_002685 [Steinernema carpocapsae]